MSACLCALERFLYRTFLCCCTVVWRIYEFVMFSWTWHCVSFQLALAFAFVLINLSVSLFSNKIWFISALSFRASTFKLNFLLVVDGFLSCACKIIQMQMFQKQIKRGTPKKTPTNTTIAVQRKWNENSIWKENHRRSKKNEHSFDWMNSMFVYKQR